MSRTFNSHGSPNNGEYTIENTSGHNERGAVFQVSWRKHKESKGEIYMHGVQVRYGGLAPLESLLDQAGYVQTKEADTDNDEFQCKACFTVCDIEDSVTFQGELICTFCGEEFLRQRNKELIADETDSVCERDY